MKFKKNNFWIQLYYSYYNYKYPKTLCGFFWKIILALFMIITSPLQLLKLIQYKFKKFYNGFDAIESDICIMDKFVQVMGIVLSVIMSEKLNLLYSFYGYVILIIFFIVKLGISTICDKLKSSYVLKSFNKPEEKEPSIIWESAKALKNKVCPIIELED